MSNNFERLCRIEPSAAAETNIDTIKIKSLQRSPQAREQTEPHPCISFYWAWRDRWKTSDTSCHSIRIFRHSIVGFTVRTLRHFSGGARPVCWCVVHVVFAFHLHVPCSETVLASRLVLLFKDAGGETVQVKGHSVVVVADVEIPVLSNHLLVAALFLASHVHVPVVHVIGLSLVRVAVGAGQHEEDAQLEENHPAGGLQEQ